MPRVRNTGIDLTSVQTRLHMTATQLGKIMYIHHNTALEATKKGFHKDEALMLLNVLRECSWEIKGLIDDEM